MVPSVRICLGLALAGAAGCVQPFDGSNLQIDFGAGVQPAASAGQTPRPDQPPADTHFVLYAADLVLDDTGAITESFQFALTEFQIRPVIDRTSPCFIELEETRFPGLHVTQVLAKVQEVTGVTDPFAPGLPSADVTDVLNAGRRMDNLPLLESALKTVTSHQPFHYPATAPPASCPPASSEALPDPGCTDDLSNAQRLRLCRALWADHPDRYEGSDKVFTLPLNGHYLGMVEGTNPINQGFVGGSSIFVDENLVGHEAYLINWQYDDLDGDGSPDFPASLPAAERSSTGYTYLVGRPQSITRGVVTVPMHHPTNPSINAELAIIPNLGHDDVHF